MPEVRRLVIDKNLAALAFPNQSAVGQRLLVRARTPEPEWFEVIGVVAHQRHSSLAREGREAMFLTDGYMGQGVVARWAVRSDSDPALLGNAIRAEVAKLDARVLVSEMQPMQKFVDHAQAQTRFALLLIGIFAALAAILAAVGLYGVLSAAVRQRTAEIGVRMALGAGSADIFRLMVGQGLRLSALGIALGLAVAVALTRVMTSMLVGVAPTDPLTFAAMVLLFFVIAAFSSWLPARRAALLDPTKALREE
jgi:putative ABC transport system permease protein